MIVMFFISCTPMCRLFVKILNLLNSEINLLSSVNILIYDIFSFRAKVLAKVDEGP